MNSAGSEEHRQGNIVFIDPAITQDDKVPSVVCSTLGLCT